MSVQSNGYLLEMHNITKIFPGTRALDNVNFSLKPGEVHALVGENGAGKSTLIKILAGIYRPDSGEIIVDGQKLSHINPAHISRLGIHFVYQEPNLFLITSVLENLFLIESSFYKHGFTQLSEAKKRASELLSQLNVKVNLNDFVFKLTQGQKQMLSIARAMVSRPKILVLDEPTAPLTAEEIKTLFKAVKDYKKAGISIIYISHRLQEIFEVADRITVLRDGKNVAFHEDTNVPMNTLITEIVAKDLSAKFPKEPVEIGETVFKVENLLLRGEFEDINFQVRKGEILGIAGVVGSGKEALGRVLFGLIPKGSGTIYVNGKSVEISCTADAIRHGVVLVPEDRREHGIIWDMNVEENISLPSLDRFSGPLGWVKRKETKRIAKDYAQQLSIRTPSLRQLLQFLSGGNQQKVVVAKWLCSKADIFILAELTAGIDVGTKTEIYKLLIEICRNGKSVILISSEFEELLGMCDRIVTLYRGHIVAEGNVQEFSREDLLHYAVGGDDRNRSGLDTEGLSLKGATQ